MKRLLCSSLLATAQVLMVAVIVAAPDAAQAECSSVNGITMAEVDGHCEIVACPQNMRLDIRTLESGKIVKSCIEKEAKDSKSFAICEGQFKDLQQAEQDQTKACSEAGMKAAEKCVEEVEACSSKSLTEEEESSLDVDALKQMMSSFGGQTLDIPSMGLKKDVCPTEGAKDYFDEKDRLQRDLKELERDNAEIEKDIADEKSKVDKETKDAQEDLTRAKKEVEKKKLDLNKEKAEKTDQAAKQANEAAEGLRKLQSQDLDIRAKISKYEGEHTRKLMQLNDKMGELSCIAQVKKTHDEMIKAGLFETTGTTNFLANAGKQKRILQKQFETCTQDFRSQRQSMEEEYRNNMRSFNQELLNIQQGIQSGQESITQSNQALQQALEDLKTGANTEDQSLIQQMQNAQQNLTNVQTTAVQRQNALRQKQSSLTLRKYQIQKDLDGLGAVPKRGTKNGWRDAERAVFTVAEKGVAFSRCCEEKESDGTQPFRDSNYCTTQRKKKWASLVKDKSSKSRSGGEGTNRPSGTGSRGGTDRPSSSGGGRGGSGSGSGSGGGGEGDSSPGRN